MKTKIKWYTTVEMVDEETGESLRKHRIENGEYIIIKKEKVNETNRNINGEPTSGRTIWFYICRPNPQYKLFGTNEHMGVN